jgi:hypothetical protein
VFEGFLYGGCRQYKQRGGRTVANRDGRPGH